MGDENMKKWNSVIVDWVNCLNVHEPINTLEDLADGEFFRKLLKDLQPKDSKVTLLDFLRTHYPGYQFPKEESLFTLKDITIAASLMLHFTCIHDRREILTSPLCNKLTNDTQKCIKNFLESFIVSETDCDLQKIIDNIFKPEPEPKVRIIAGTPRRTLEWNSSGESPLIASSPLYEYLKTPISHMHKFREKVKEVKLLKEELESERFDKEDLLSELKEHKDKITLLTQQVNEKSSLILKLNENVRELEEESAKLRANSSNEIESKLRFELADSQSYLKLLQKEQDELRSSYEAASLKLKESEIAIFSWQSKSLEADSKYEALFEKYSAQEVELRNLRGNCNELTALLEEFRSVDKSNISLDASSSVPTLERSAYDTEDLACSVVEVQLKESQQQNDDLKIKLISLTDENTDLTSKLLTLSQEKEDLQNNNADLRSDLKDLTEKRQEIETIVRTLEAEVNNLNSNKSELEVLLQESSKENSILEKKLEDLQENIQDLNEKKGELVENNASLLMQIEELIQSQKSLESSHAKLASEFKEFGILKHQEIEELNAKLEDLKENHQNTIESFQKTKETLKGENEHLKSEYENLQKSLQTKTEQYELLRHESNCLQVTYDNVLQNYREKNVELETITDKLKDFEFKFSENLSRLETIVSSSSDYNSNNRFELFSHLIDEIEKAFVSHSNKETNYIKSLEQTNILNSTLEKEIKILKQNEDLNLQEISDLRKQLNDLEMLSESLQTKIDQKSIQVEEFQKEIEVFKKTVEELQNLKITLAESESNVESLQVNLNNTMHELQVISNVATDLKMRNEDLNNNLENCISQNVHLIEENRSLITREKDSCELLNKCRLDLKNTLKDLHDSNESNSETINTLKLEISSLESSLKQLQVDLEMSREECATKTKEYNDIKLVKVDLQNQCIEINKDYNKKISLLNNTINTLENKLEVSLKDKDIVKGNLERECEKLSFLNEEKDVYMKQCESLQVQITHLSDLIKRKEDECIEKDDVISYSNRELLAIKLELQENHKIIEEMRKESEIMNNEKEEVSRKVAMYEKTNLELERNVESLTIEVSMITKLRDTVEINSQKIYGELLEAFRNLGVQNNDLFDGLKELQQVVKDREQEVVNLNEKLREKNLEIQRISELCSLNEKDLNAQLSTNQIKSENLQEQIEQMKTEELKHLREISYLKEELDEAVSQYTAALEREKEVKMENELQVNNLTDSIHSMVSKYNQLDKEQKTLLEETKYNKNCIDDLQIVKSTLEAELLELRSQYENDIKMCAEEHEREYEALNDLEIRIKSTIDSIISCFDEIPLGKELEAARGQLQLVDQEKADLIKKGDVLKELQKTFTEEFASMKISGQISKYMKRNKLTLESNLKKLEEAMTYLQSNKNELKLSIESLERNVQNLNAQLEENDRKLVETREVREADLIQYQEKLPTLQGNINKLSVENECLKKQIAEDTEKYDRLTNENDRKDSKISELGLQIAKLKAAQDILETGKRNVEKVRDELERQLNEMHKAHEKERLHFEETRLLLTEEIDNLKEKAEEQAKEICVKDYELQAANEEFDEIKVILTNMTKKMNRKLSTIHEDYDCKLMDEKMRFDSLKEQYETVKNEINYVFAEYEKLRSELDACKEQRSSAEVLIRDKEAVIFEMQRKYGHVVLEVSRKDDAIASLQAELDAKLEQLEDDFGQKLRLERERQEATEKLQHLERQKGEMMEQHAEYVRNSGEAMEMLRLEASNLLQRSKEIHVLNDDKKQLSEKIDLLLCKQSESEKFYTKRVDELALQLNEGQEQQIRLKENILKLSALVLQNSQFDVDDNLDKIIGETERLIIEKLANLRVLDEALKKTEVERDHTNQKYKELQSCFDGVKEEKQKLIEKYENLHQEKIQLAQDKDKQSKCLENLKMQYDEFKNNNDMKSRCSELEQTLESMKQQNSAKFENYRDFILKSKNKFKQVEDLISKRNAIDNLVYLLKEKHINVIVKASYITEESHKLFYEQKVALGVIIDDIHKQFVRLSKMAYSMNIACCQNFEKVVTNIMNDQTTDWETGFSAMNTEELNDKLDDLKDNVSNTLEQLEGFIKSIDMISHKDGGKSSRLLKENLHPQSLHPQGSEIAGKVKDEDWKKKYMMTKQRLTLVENAKNNFERKIKELREENKKLLGKISSGLDTELVDKYNLLKQQHESLITEYEIKFAKLAEELTCKELNAESINGIQEISTKKELESLQQEYNGAKVKFEKLEIEYESLKKLLSEKQMQIISLTASKESYQSLFEENNKLKSEIDTLKYKRTRDREEYVRLIKKKERDYAESNGKVNEIKNEYEIKLEKMKDKMVDMFKEQVSKNDVHNIEKLTSIKDENQHYKDTIIHLRNEIEEIKTRNLLLESERAMAMQQLKMYQKLDHQQREDFDNFKEPHKLPRQTSSRSLMNERCAENMDDRRYSTLPRRMEGTTLVEELRIQKLTSFAASPNQVEMEDDMFNNKYLAELKEGRPSMSCGRESTRLSELAYRNSLCPPHLKSSYPLETQFVNNRQFKDDDLKSGKVDFDESMSTQLLPNEIKAKKKDIGTTSYKRPGPPTPSKNGGRTSLQSSDFKDRELCRDSLEPKRNTPNSLRALFSKQKDNSEGSQMSPKKRFSFFRKPR